MIEVVEHFLSLGGEAPILGEPAYLYRFTGCNLNCSYCDTLYKNEVNFKFNEDELISDIRKKCRLYPDIKILFTGGEPLLGKRKDIIIRIAKRVPETDFYIETNGSVELPKCNLHNCHFVCDYKSPASGESESFNKINLERLVAGRDCIKFVINEIDLDWFKDKVKYIKKINNGLKVYVSPVFGKIELKKLADYIIENKLPVIMSIQLHKIIWPDIERGVQ